MFDKIPDELKEQVESYENDPAVDLDSTNRQDAGWVREYVECPKCDSPMAQHLVNSTSTADTRRYVSRSEHRCICPSCHEWQASVQLTKYTTPFGDSFPDHPKHPVRELDRLQAQLAHLAGLSVELYEALGREDHELTEDAEFLWEELDKLVETARGVRTTIELDG